jgi:two-component sensor histidine kinase
VPSRQKQYELIIALLKMQADYFEDEHRQTAFIETENRIRSMALVHQKLY